MRLSFCYSPKFASDDPGGRDYLERARRYLLKNGAFQHTSISHTEGLGALALSDRPVGIDLEMRHRRISQKTYNRLGDAAERRLVSDPLTLWVAKEAAWKATQGPKQPTVITSIKISQLAKMRTEDGLRFLFYSKNSAHLEPSGHGILIFRGRYILGIAVLDP